MCVSSCTRVLGHVQPACAPSTAARACPRHVLAHVYVCSWRVGAVSPPPTPQQLLPQHRALTLDGASQLSLYTSPSLPNISLGLQATVTVTNSHLNVSGAGAGGLARGPCAPWRCHGDLELHSGGRGDPTGGEWREDLMSHRGGLGTWHLVGLAWGPCAVG